MTVFFGVEKKNDRKMTENDSTPEEGFKKWQKKDRKWHSSVYYIRYFYFFILKFFSLSNMEFITFFFKFQFISKGIIPLFFILSKKVICIMHIRAFVWILFSHYINSPIKCPFTEMEIGNFAFYCNGFIKR
jgi:fatty acid desaturase